MAYNNKRNLLPLALFAFFAVGAVFAANYLPKSRLNIFNSRASSVGPFDVVPCSGNWNLTDCFKLTNTSGTAVNLKYTLDCWDETKCADSRDQFVLINPTQTVQLGLAHPCSKWQLDINWSGDDGWDWGAVVEVSPSCGTPVPASPTPVPTPTPTCSGYVGFTVSGSTAGAAAKKITLVKTSAGGFINVDAVKIDGTQVEQTSTQLAYSGTWTTFPSSGYTAGSDLATNVSGASVSFFAKTSAVLVAAKAPNLSTFDVYVDGVKKATINQYNVTQVNQQQFDLTSYLQ